MVLLLITENYTRNSLLFQRSETLSLILVRIGFICANTGYAIRSTFALELNNLQI
jgi:hypothetical protein